MASDQACLEAVQQFKEWYKQCGNIQAVLDGYLPFLESLADRLAFRPLFSQLADCEIYDISEDTYWNRYIGSEESESALETVERQYNDILKRQNAEKEYRADRKAGRGHYRSYTSFHSDYWLRDQAEAGVKNLASFAGHTLWNAIGNAGSAIAASADKSSLYKNSATQDALMNGILADIITAYYAHMDFLNEHTDGFIQSAFDEDKSSALLENAKKLPEKRENLLVQAFTLCPWNTELVQYIFVHFPQDRKTAYAAAQRFSIGLSDTVEEILSQEYNEEAQASEPAAQAAKKRILAQMQEYGVLESVTLDRLETDCLRRLCGGYQAADEAACVQLIEKVRQYQAQEKLKDPFFELLHKRIESIWLEELDQICQGYETADEAACESFLAATRAHKAPDGLKAPFLQKVQDRIESIWLGELTQICQSCEAADEATCEKMIDAIKAHKAPDAMKAPFLQKVQTRIESIWSAEDGEIFDNLYVKTDITDPRAVAEAISYVQSKGRTDSSQKYLDALDACMPKNIENARLYQNTNRYKLYIALAILSILGCVVLPITWIAAIPLFIMARNLKKSWKLLTIQGEIIHPALIVEPHENGRNGQ